MATPPLKGVCCRSAYQTSGGQCVITSFDVPMKEELLVDNLDTVEARSVSIILKLTLLCAIFVLEPIVMYNSAQYFGTWSYTDSYYYYCSSSSYSSLIDCTRQYVSSYCDSNNQVGLWCTTIMSSTGTYCVNCMRKVIFELDCKIDIAFMFTCVTTVYIIFNRMQQWSCSIGWRTIIQ